jgi:hypothetical protein
VIGRKLPGPDGFNASVCLDGPRGSGRTDGSLPPIGLLCNGAPFQSRHLTPFEQGDFKNRGKGPKRRPRISSGVARHCWYSS